MKLQFDQQRPGFVDRIEMTRVERKRVIVGQQRLLVSFLLALEITDPAGTSSARQADGRALSCEALAPVSHSLPPLPTS